MDETGASNSGIFIKEEKLDETESVFPMTDIKQETGTLFYCDGMIDEKQEREALIRDEISNGSVVIKEEKTDDNEATFPTVGIRQEEGSLFVCGGLIPEQVGETFVPDGGLSHVKQEEEMIIPDEGYQNSLGKLEHQCPHCNFTAADMVCLERHIIACNKSEERSDDTTMQSNDIETAHHIEENPRQCPHCEYKAVYPSKLKMHIMARHTGEKPHQCPHCEYTALMYHNLKTHIMARHAGEKPHQCPHCDYTALKKYSVKIHIMARHTGEKPRECPHCDYKSVTISCLKKHIMSQHLGQKPLQCPHCDYKSVSISCLKEHIMALHLGEKPHQCPHCDYRATQKSNLKSHIKYLHKNLNKQPEVK